MNRMKAINIISAFILVTGLPAEAFSQRNDSVPPAVITIPLADTTVTFFWHAPGNSKLMFLVIHDDEITSTQVGYNVMDEYNASLLELKNSEKYLCTIHCDSVVYLFNPNRIFSLNGIEGSLMRYGPCIPEIVDKIDLFAGQVAGAFFHYPGFIVALHNNRNNGFSVESYCTDTVLRLTVDSIYINPKEDPDDFFFVNDPAHFSFIREQGFNVVLQAAGDYEDDGSASVWCNRMGIPYINIEAELGRYEQQLNMLEAIRELLPVGE